jgi:hypothetical protein
MDLLDELGLRELHIRLKLELKDKLHREKIAAKLV